MRWREILTTLIVSGLLAAILVMIDRRRTPPASPSTSDPRAEFLERLLWRVVSGDPPASQTQSAVPPTLSNLDPDLAWNEAEELELLRLEEEAKLASAWRTSHPYDMADPDEAHAG